MLLPYWLVTSRRAAQPTLIRWWSCAMNEAVEIKSGDLKKRSNQAGLDSRNQIVSHLLHLNASASWMEFVPVLTDNRLSALSFSSQPRLRPAHAGKDIAFSPTIRLLCVFHSCRRSQTTSNMSRH